MGILLRGGQLEGQRWEGAVNPEDKSVSRRIGMGEKITYEDSGEIDPATGWRIFTYRPPKLKPIESDASAVIEDEDDDE